MPTTSFSKASTHPQRRTWLRPAVAALAAVAITACGGGEVVGRVNFGADACLALLARSVAPVAGVTVDTTNRRIGFVNVVVGGANSTLSLTLDGSLEYPTNIDAAARAACG